MTPRPLTDVNQAMENNLHRKALSYDSQTAQECAPGGGEQSIVNGIFKHLLYGFVRLPEVGPEQRNLAVVVQTTPNWEGPLYLVHQVYDSQAAHGCSPGHGKQSSVKGIFVYLLYGFVRLPEVGPE